MVTTNNTPHTKSYQGKWLFGKNFRTKNPVKGTTTTPRGSGSSELPEAIATPILPVARFVTLRSFSGNAAERQLSFPRGAVVTIDPVVSPSQGWVWVTNLSTGQEGWCPLSYLVQDTTPEPPKSKAPGPPRKEGGGGGGFFGFLPGASSPGQASRAACPGRIPPTPAVPSASKAVPPAPSNGLRESLSKLGSDVRRVSQTSWQAVSQGAQQLGTHAQATLTDLAEKQREVAHKHQRTEGEQRLVDAGNFAARGAVVGAVGRAVFDPLNPRAIARDATRGAVTGATYGAVRNWKPFG